jgi:hypothetical protein
MRLPLLIKVAAQLPLLAIYSPCKKSPILLQQ